MQPRRSTTDTSSGQSARAAGRRGTLASGSLALPSVGAAVAVPVAAVPLAVPVPMALSTAVVATSGRRIADRWIAARRLTHGDAAVARRVQRGGGVDPGAGAGVRVAQAVPQDEQGDHDPDRGRGQNQPVLDHPLPTPAPNPPPPHPTACPPARPPACPAPTTPPTRLG